MLILREKERTMKSKWQDIARRFASFVICFGMVFSNLQVSAIAQDTTPTNVVTEDANGEATNEQTPVTTD